VTASAGYFGRILGDFDVKKLRQFRELAERHTTKALTSITAAADPSDFIDQSFLDEFAVLASESWDEALGLITLTFGQLPVPIYQSVIDAGIRNSVHYYDELLRALIGKKGFKEPIYGEFLKGSNVQYGDVRPLLARLGGGTSDPSVQLAGGITSGNTMNEWLRSNGIDTNKKIWLYGYDDPRRTFNGHLQMDGLVFESWEDDGLKISPQDAWLRRSHYQPGDHFGCACIVAPYIPNMGPEFQIELPV